MSYIYEVLIEASGSLSQVAAQVSAATNKPPSSEQNDPREVLLDEHAPLIVTTAGYGDEGPTMMVSRYNFSPYAWDESIVRSAFDALKKHTDWPIALFNEEKYVIVEQRDTLSASA